jgi:hypothetical protein
MMQPTESQALGLGRCAVKLWRHAWAAMQRVLVPDDRIIECAFCGGAVVQGAISTVSG